MKLPEVYRMLDEQPPVVEIKMADGIFVKQMLIRDAGTFIPQHAHVYDHLSMLAVGSVNVWRDGADLGVFHAPCGIHIPANTLHTFQALEPNTVVYCIHLLRDAEGEVEVAREHHVALVEGD